MSKYSTDNEVWEDIEGYEGYYQVSNLGRVRSVDRVATYKDGRVRKFKGKILKTTLRNGYPRVILSKENHSNHQSVHRLVAIHFIDNPENLGQVNHIDCDKTNNRMDNLEWVSHLQNAQHANENGRYRRGLNHQHSKIRLECIPDILNMYFVEGLHQEDIANKYNVSQTHISRVVGGETWHFLLNLDLIELRNSLL